MEKKKLIELSKMSDEDVISCEILEERDGYIRFSVDDGLSLPTRNLPSERPEDIINHILHEEQIAPDLAHVVYNGVGDGGLSYVGKDVLFQTIVTCFAEHRPLVLSPDMIWLLVEQTMAKRIDGNPEAYRDSIVGFDGTRDLTVESGTDIFDENMDWTCLLQDMYEQILANSKAKIASKMACDFTTTGIRERIASIATLMGGLKTYFRYHVCHYVCGIPEVTLLGTVSDWESVLKKVAVLKRLKMTSWNEWLRPILNEFLRSAKGCPSLAFWKNIVLQTREGDFRAGRSCSPDRRDMDGWCVALFPFVDGNRRRLGKCKRYQTMDGEMSRTGFVYQRVFPNGQSETFPMELWSGFVGVEEDKKTFALKPRIGWFVRRSVVEEENLARLGAQDRRYGIDLTIETVPEILKKMQHIDSLTLTFVGKVQLPEWLAGKDIDRLTVFGKVSREERKVLKSMFKNIKINPY